jgi:hypothetical protein
LRDASAFLFPTSKAATHSGSHAVRGASRIVSAM